MKKNKIEKGNYGYINAYRSLYIKRVTAWVLAIILVIGGGILITGSKFNYVTIVGILMVLPAAKTLIGLIVMLPYKSGDKQEYEEISNITGDACTLYADLVLTRYEGSMAINMAIVTSRHIYAYIPAQKASKSIVESYLKEIAASGGSGCKATVYTEYKTFKNSAARITANTDTEVKANTQICKDLLSKAV